MQLYNWMSQAKADAKEGLIPAVFHKKNNHKILVTLEFDDFMEIYKEYEASMSLKERYEKEKNNEKSVESVERGQRGADRDSRHKE